MSWLLTRALRGPEAHPAAGSRVRRDGAAPAPGLDRRHGWAVSEAVIAFFALVTLLDLVESNRRR
ncbi:hypothetical protein ACGFIY_15265 [Micromonospora chersina]|uniref:hypothetical protein n=1 Tax=Micromonospora chersina TaxID=47854 RepID=UPI00371451FC